MNALNPLKITHIAWILWLIALIGLQKDKAVAQITPTVGFSLIEPLSQPSLSPEQLRQRQQGAKLLTKDFPATNWPKDLNITQTPIIWLSCQGGSKANSVLIIHRPVILYNPESILEGNAIWQDMRSLTRIDHKQSPSRNPSHPEGVSLQSISQSAHAELMQATAWIKITGNKIFLVGKAPVERFSGNWLSYANCQRK